MRLVFYNDFSIFYEKMKMILWSIRTFWYKGSAENEEKMQVRTKAPFLKNNSPDWKADFPKKSKKQKNTNSQMHCKLYTRYKSNPIYQIS